VIAPTQPFCPGCGRYVSPDSWACDCGYECPEEPGFPSVERLMSMDGEEWNNVNLAAVVKRLMKTCGECDQVPDMGPAGNAKCWRQGDKVVKHDDPACEHFGPAEDGT